MKKIRTHITIPLDTDILVHRYMDDYGCKYSQAVERLIEIGSKNILLEKVVDRNNAFLDKIYSNDITLDLYSTVTAKIHTNNLRDFKKELDENEEIKKYLSAIKYSYDIDVNIYKQNADGTSLQVNPSDSVDDIIGNRFVSGFSMGGMSSGIWKEMLDNQELLDSQYDLVYGSWPRNYNEVVLVADKNNEISA